MGSNEIWWQYYYSTHPKIGDWKIKEVLSAIEKTRSASGGAPVILVGCNDAKYNFATFRYYMAVEHINAILLNFAISWHQEDEFNAGRYDLLLYKTAGYLSSVARCINMNPRKFTVICNELLPDRTRVIIYKLIK
jgi:hypothetical protein